MEQHHRGPFAPGIVQEIIREPILFGLIPEGSMSIEVDENIINSFFGIIPDDVNLNLIVHPECPLEEGAPVDLYLLGALYKSAGTGELIITNLDKQDSYSIDLNGTISKSRRFKHILVDKRYILKQLPYQRGTFLTLKVNNPDRIDTLPMPDIKAEWNDQSQTKLSMAIMGLTSKLCASGCPYVKKCAHGSYGVDIAQKATSTSSSSRS